MPQVPYTRSENLSAEDLAYLGDRAAKSPAICQLLQLGEVLRNQQQITTQLDTEGALGGGYVALTEDDPST